MNYRKSRFRYTRDQRNGIFYLLLFMLVGQLAFYWWSASTNTTEPIVDNELLARFEAERDSLMALKQQQDSVLIYRYNPNYLSDFRAYQLGLSVREIDRLQIFRSAGKFINTEKEFQKITGISDSLMQAVRPYLKFKNFVPEKREVIPKDIEKQDINLASAEDLQVVNGIGSVLSERIVKYRNRLQGFSFEDQLLEVYNLKPETVSKVWKYFEIKSIPKIDKLDINAASFKELIGISYIDYELAKKILEYRDMVAEIQGLEELRKIDGFPVDKLDRIALYLSAN